MTENYYSKEYLQDQILEIQSLVQQIDQSENNKQVIQKLNSKCNQLNQQLEQSNTFRNNNNDDLGYNELTKINSPLDDYTNLV